MVPIYPQLGILRWCTQVHSHDECGGSLSPQRSGMAGRPVRGSAHMRPPERGAEDDSIFFFFICHSKRNIPRNFLQLFLENADVANTKPKMRAEKQFEIFDRMKIRVIF